MLLMVKHLLGILILKKGLSVGDMLWTCSRAKPPALTSLPNHWLNKKRDPVPEKIDNVLLVLCKLFAKVKPNMKDKCNKHYPRLTVDKHDMIILTKFSLGSFDTELFEVICMLSLKCANGSTIQWDNNTYNCIHAGIRFYTQYKFSHKVPWLSPSK